MSDQNQDITPTQVDQSLRVHKDYWGNDNDPNPRITQQVAADRPRDIYRSRDISLQRRFGINRASERLTRLAETAKNGNETVFAFDGDHTKSCFAPTRLAIEGHLFASAAEALDAFAEWAAQRGRLGVPAKAFRDGARYALVEYRAQPTMIEWVPTIISDF